MTKIIWLSYYAYGMIFMLEQNFILVLVLKNTLLKKIQSQLKGKAAIDKYKNDFVDRKDDKFCGLAVVKQAKRTKFYLRSFGLETFIWSFYGSTHLA